MKREPFKCDGGWEGRYVAGDTPWDLGEAPPVLKALVSSTAGAPLRVFVPGVGRGHDAICWAEAGHHVTALDIAPTAVAAARELAAAAGVEVDWREADLFELPADLESAFDVVWEQTCLCAFPPDRWEAYAEVVAGVLRPGGTYHGLFWHTGAEGGPPWDVTRADVEALLPPRFEIEQIEDVPAWSPERWDEFIVRARLR